MPNVNCAVVSCFNNTKKIKKWKEQLCEVHENVKHEQCGCDRPFKMYCFPSIRYKEQRDKWTNAMKREKSDKSKWEPKSSDRVCSIHFVDGVPTAANPDPTLKLGYETPIRKPRRELYRKPLPPKKLKLCSSDMENQCNSSTSDIDGDADGLFTPPFEHSYFKTPTSISCSGCTGKQELINSLVSKVNSLTLRNQTLSREKMFNSVKSSTFTWRKIKSDEKMNFYTGFTTIALFNAIFILLKPYLSNLRYWRGPKQALINKYKHTKPNKTALKKLTHRDEFLLTLMRLRLGLLNEDVADRFGISTGLASSVFTTWIKVISLILGRALVVWLPRESIRDNLPEVFVKAGYSKCRVILDCAEVFIERPKSLLNQACTWSDYKHHNTLKFLIGISPTGFISFLSNCYGGRSSDKFITKDSGFYELLERDDEVMADRGFQIQEELLLRFCKLVVPPGARLKSQMTSAECRKTKDVANLRIHVERAINRIKFYRILKGTLPITMLRHADDIVLSCAALCNLKPVLIKKKKQS